MCSSGTILSFLQNHVNKNPDQAKTPLLERDDLVCSPTETAFDSDPSSTRSSRDHSPALGEDENLSQIAYQFEHGVIYPDKPLITTQDHHQLASEIYSHGDIRLGSYRLESNDINKLLFELMMFEHAEDDKTWINYLNNNGLIRTDNTLKTKTHYYQLLRDIYYKGDYVKESHIVVYKDRGEFFREMMSRAVSNDASWRNYTLEHGMISTNNPLNSIHDHYQLAEGLFLQGDHAEEKHFALSKNMQNLVADVLLMSRPGVDWVCHLFETDLIHTTNPLKTAEDHYQLARALFSSGAIGYGSHFALSKNLPELTLDLIKQAAQEKHQGAEKWIQAINENNGALISPPIHFAIEDESDDESCNGRDYSVNNSNNNQPSGYLTPPRLSI